MLAYGKKIVILPFKRDISSMKAEEESSEGDISLEGLRYSHYRGFRDITVQGTQDSTVQGVYSGFRDSTERGAQGQYITEPRRLRDSKVQELRESKLMDPGA